MLSHITQILSATVDKKRTGEGGSNFGQAVRDGLNQADKSVEIYDGLGQFRSFLLAWFPFLSADDLDSTKLWMNLQRFAFTALLLLAAFFLLAPSSTNRKSHNNNDGSNTDPVDSTNDSDNNVGKKSTWSISNFHSWFQRGPGSGYGSGSSVGDESDEDASIGQGGWIEDVETDEDRFEQDIWPSLIEGDCPYRRLVLPPTCRLMEPSALSQRQKRKVEKLKQIKIEEEKKIKHEQAVSHEERVLESSDSTRTLSIDDDNPIVRMQAYLHSFGSLLFNLVRLDIAGAIWTMMLWIYNIWAHRSNKFKQGQDRSEDDEEDEGADDASKQQEPANSERTIGKHQEVGDDGSHSGTVGLKESLRQHEHGKDRESGKEQKVEDLSSTQADTETLSNVSKASSCDAEHVRDDQKSAKENNESTSSDNQDSHKDKDASSRPSIYFDLSNNVNHPDSSNANDETTDATTMDSVDSSMVAANLKPNQDHDKTNTPHKGSTKNRDALEFYRRASNKSDRTTELEHDEMQETNDKTSTNFSAQNATNSATNETFERRKIPSQMAMKNEPSAYYFESANSTDKLKEFSIQVPLPDKNGYILGDDFLDPETIPLLVFVNSRSGPQTGSLLITQLRRLLNPIQVWDLAQGGPETILESFLAFSRLRLLVCGGDGTVSWVIGALDGMDLKRKWPPIAILPMGTGNDLARIHGWGGGYNNESLITILEQVSESYTSLLDRWELVIKDKKKSKKNEQKTFLNYLGVGADAQAALQVHYLRESRPQWFFSRMVNKAWYGIFGAEDMIKASSANIRKKVKLVADGVEIPLPSDSQGIILLNIDSYAGGVPLWSHGVNADLRRMSTTKSPRRTQSLDDACPRQLTIERKNSRDDLHVMTDDERFSRVVACDRPSSCQDGYLEVVSIRGAFHLGQIKVGLASAQRLCQCSEAVITVRDKMAVQIDGEPWRQRPCVLRVRSKKGAAMMLHRSSDDGGIELEMSQLLDWAEESNLIDGEVHTTLMKEFSRRIEAKTRKKRVRENGIFNFS